MISQIQFLLTQGQTWPATPLKSPTATDQLTMDNMANDRCASETISLPLGSCHRIFRGGDFAAVLSKCSLIRHIALWSLITKQKVWELEIPSNGDGELHPGSCLLNACGMAIVDTGCSFGSFKSKVIVLNGEHTGMLPAHHWRSIASVGMRILCSWAERHNPDDQEPCWLPENTNNYFGEWDHKGTLLSRYQLDFTRGRWNSLAACSEHYWVRLVGSKKADLPSIIEVVDRLGATMRTFELPLIPEEIRFSSACIVKNTLVYRKNVIRQHEEYGFDVWHDPTICIYDLVKGTMTGEFPTGTDMGTPKWLVANEHYAAWLEYQGGDKDEVKYLDFTNQTIKVATIVPHCICSNDTGGLNIHENILSVTYGEGSWLGMYGTSFWRRKVIDLTNGELKSSVRYQRMPWGECSVSNGIMLITDMFSSRGSALHIESFVGKDLSKGESSFRIAPK